MKKIIFIAALFASFWLSSCQKQVTEPVTVINHYDTVNDNYLDNVIDTVTLTPEFSHYSVGYVASPSDSIINIRIWLYNAWWMLPMNMNDTLVINYIVTPGNIGISYWGNDPGTEKLKIFFVK